MSEELPKAATFVGSKSKTFPIVRIVLRRRGSNRMGLGLARRPLPSLLLISASLSFAVAMSASAADAGDRPNSANKQVDTGAIDSKAAVNGTRMRTRFVIGLERDAKFLVSVLNNPNRVVIDLPEMKLQLPGDTGGSAIGLINSFRAGISAPGRARIVIDVTSPVVIDNRTIEKTPDGKGYRLALEIVPARSAVRSARKSFKTAPFALGAADVQPPLPRAAVRPAVKAAKSYKPVIVIDPGHGGIDSGAKKNGTVEKEVVLAFSKVLKKRLEESGQYRVLMTRETDVFVELDERLAFAKRNKANLFIAVHADYARSKARGATIYSLRKSMANSLEGSAKREVAKSVLSSGEVEIVKKAGVGSDVEAVKNILADLARREVDSTRERTNLFTRVVVDNMSESTTMRDEPEQQAGFRVLKTAQFPSVLIELAYVTNQEDAKRLKSDSWRSNVADSIKTAIDTYFTQQVARLPM